MVSLANQNMVKAYSYLALAFEPSQNVKLQGEGMCVCEHVTLILHGYQAL